ncbi:hypothetical protein SI65_02830 [Aspergillus cristatus]|uniref:DUF7770 domain-containing protein n=1 Tax=Aspergillus cristatus TaxID=573508 RepID=A0A1E3BNP0_ASPCR|nr:hypothetical protein SI65_02830 [Aspergillus cristatus]
MSTSLTEADYTLPVKYIRVIIEVPETGHESDTYSGSHPSIYLLTSDGGSVRVNMHRAKPEDTMGTYVLERCSYWCIDYPLKVVDLSAVKGLTVGDVTGLVEGKGRVRYKLADSGTGCRFWVKTVIDDLNAAGYIDESAASITQAQNALQYNYRMEEEDFQYEEMIPGTFV